MPLAHPPVLFLKERCKEELFTPSHGCVLYGCLFSVGQVETENDQVRFFLRLVSLGFALELSLFEALKLAAMLALTLQFLLKQCLL